MEFTITISLRIEDIITTPFLQKYRIDFHKMYLYYIHMIFKEYRMEELLSKLEQIPNSYRSFVMGVMAYARKKPERVDVLLDYINNNDELTCSDIVKYVSLQPDFYEDNVASFATKVG